MEDESPTADQPWRWGRSRTDADPVTQLTKEMIEAAVAEIARQGEGEPVPHHELLFGYRMVTGVPLCRCGDPGNYLMLERINGLRCRFRCWCGSTMHVEFDDEAELQDFLRKQGVAVA